MKDFTSQQKEVVARKLGYDGPMQGFDEFLASSPALEAKYASITGKFSQRMANGGLVKMKPRGFPAGGYVTTDSAAPMSEGLTWALNNGFSQEDYYTNVLTAFQQAVAGGLDNNAIKTEMIRYGVSPSDLATAIKADVAVVQEAYDAAVPITTAPPTTVPPTTVPPTTPAPTTTVPPTTRPGTTFPPTTIPGTTLPVTTRPVTTLPVTTRPVTTVPVTTTRIVTTPAPTTTVPRTTVPGTTRLPGVTLSPADAAAALATRTAATQTGGNVTYSATGVPQAADAAQVSTIATIEPTEAQKIGTEERAGTVSTIEGTTPATAC